MVDVPPLYIVGAIIPATMIAVLYYFDHSVASQLAQQKEFNLKKPSSYHYDLLLLGFLVSLFCLNQFGQKRPHLCYYLGISHHLFLNLFLTDHTLRSHRHSAFEWCDPTISHAHEELSYFKASGYQVTSPRPRTKIQIGLDMIHSYTRSIHVDHFMSPSK